jgi:hypothetical protein
LYYDQERDELKIQQQQFLINSTATFNPFVCIQPTYPAKTRVKEKQGDITPCLFNSSLMATLKWQF